MTRRRILVKGIIGTAGMGIILLWTEGFAGCRYNKAVKLDTPAWGIYGELHVRREWPQGDALLFRFLALKDDVDRARRGGVNIDPSVVYRYTPGATHLEATTMESWDAAAGKVIDCNGGGGGGSGYPHFTIDPKTRRLLFDAQRMAMTGRTILGTEAAHKSELLAVYTGGRRGADPPFKFILGEAPVYGNRYHQFFSKSDGKPRGSPLILSSDSDDYFHTPCWSEDDNFVIYAAFRFEYICVIANPYASEERK